jgi:hypothetical protein
VEGHTDRVQIYPLMSTRLLWFNEVPSFNVACLLATSCAVTLALETMSAAYLVTGANRGEQT